MNAADRSDIYIACVSASHNVAPADTWIAIVSTIVETSVPERELLPGIQLLGGITDKFFDVSSLYEPTDSGEASNIFITKSYDATSHFETVVDDVKDVWKRVTGSDLVLKKKEPIEESEGA